MTQEEKNALKRWEEHHKALAADVPVEDFTSQTDIDRKRKKLEADPVLWIKYFFPKYARYEFAPFHINAIKRVIEHDEWYEVLSWSRELAKSTVAMFICMYLALTKRKRFFVLASATIDSAKRLLAPYKINFESNPRIRQFYGSQITLGQWTDSEFTAKCGAKFIALGAGSAPRGARNEEIRPDVIYLDDYDTDEDCRNPETLKKKWDWFEASLYPTRSISQPTLILWCGNIIAKDCCIKRAGAKAKHWDIVNIRDKNGNSTWPAKNTEQQIDIVLSNISTKSAQAEYFNNPVSEGSIFKYLPFGKVPSLRKFKFLILYGDPAYSDSRKKASSTKALWLVGKYKGVYYIIKGFLARELNATFISWYFDIIEYVAGRSNVYCYMENNKLQDPFFTQVFKPLLRQECNKRNKQLFIKGDERKKTDKATRIEANLEPIDRNAAWIFNEQERDNPHMNSSTSSNSSRCTCHTMPTVLTALRVQSLFLKTKSLKWNLLSPSHTTNSTITTHTECNNMANFINTSDYDATIHREILDSLLRKESTTYDPQIIEICEDRAIAEMKGYLNKAYDCEKIFSAEVGDRNPLILMFAIDITVYHIFCQHNPYKIAKIRQDRYERAIEWLKGVMKGDITIDGAPKLPDDVVADNSRWQIMADKVRPTFL